MNLIQNGVEIKTVNVGNMSQSDETKSITSSINVVQSDVDAFQELHSLGVNITAQMVPSDPILNFMDLLKILRFSTRKKVTIDAWRYHDLASVVINFIFDVPDLG